MRLIEACPICSKKPLVVTSTNKFGDLSILTTKCGHLLTEAAAFVTEDSLDFTSVNGDKCARDYQKIGIKAIIDANFCFCLGDQMRLGKTPQSLLALKNRYIDRTPCLIVVRAANLWEWIRQYHTWVDPTPLGIYPIIGTKAFIPPGFKSYIISMDTLSRKGMVDKLLEFGFKLVIADEAHSFKNTDSNRSQAIVKFLHDIHEEQTTTTLTYNCAYCKHSWDAEVVVTINLRTESQHSMMRHTSYCPKCGSYVAQAQERKDPVDRNKECGVVLLSGTFVKNAAEEMFVPLNLVAPTRVTSRESFRRTWLEQDTKGKWSRVNRYRREAFREFIKPFFLRREKEDVYTDLPPLNRIFTIIEPARDNLIEQYNKILAGMEKKLAERANPTYWDYQDDMMALRRITGLMKLPWTADYVEASLIDSDNSRIAVGIHHKDVRDILAYKLAHLGVLKLSGMDSPEQKDMIMRTFEHSPERVLVINELAGGVGMDFHYCDNIVILERQWSAADEEQFEFRFYNPDKSIKNTSTNVEYVMIRGSFEEFWYNMVESKRCIAGETIGTNWNIQTQPKVFRALLEETIGHRL